MERTTEKKKVLMDGSHRLETSPPRTLESYLTPLA